jgi:hypothetical protein
LAIVTSDSSAGFAASKKSQAWKERVNPKLRSPWQHPSERIAQDSITPIMPLSG